MHMQPGRQPAAQQTPMFAALVLLASGSCALEVNCQIFDETMVCDSEKDSVARGEIRTCSG